MTEQTLTFVSHTHWDREWYQPFQEYRIRLVQLVDKLLDIFEQNPDYQYFMLDGQTIILDDYLDVRPEKRAKLEQYVRSGRLLIGPWYILPDEFLVSPESTIRNLLVGAAACDRFGRRMDVGNIPDPFGHISQMPQILRGFDIDAMAFWRGVSGVKNEFVWEAPDGTDILVIHQQHGYGNASNMPLDPQAFIGRTKHIVEALTPTATTPHLLAMNGSDHVEPQSELPGLIEVADEALPEVEIRHGTLPQFVEAVRDADPDLNTHRGEMRDPAKAPLLPGVLSTRMWIKQRNHAAETLLTSWAEPAVALAETLGAPLELTDQSALVRKAWHYLLQNHPHDSICGCSVDQVHREMDIRFDWVDQIGEELTSRNLQALAAWFRTPDAPSVVVFNPSTRTRTDWVSTRIPIPEEAESVVLETKEGQSFVPNLMDRHRDVVWEFTAEVERVRSMVGYLGGRTINGADIHEIKVAAGGEMLDLEIKVGMGAPTDLEAIEHGRSELMDLINDPEIETVHILVHRGETIACAFVAEDVPGVGYRSYTIRAAEPADFGPRDLEFNVIENDYLRVAVADDGTLTLEDRATGVRYPGLNRFVDVGDRGDEYNFCPVENDVTIESPSDGPHVSQIDIGSDRQALEVTSVYQIPVGLGETRHERSPDVIELPIRTRISLTTGVPRVEIETTVTNVASDHRLRVHFPVPAQVDTFDAEGHMDVITRSLDLPTDTADWVEEPIGTHPQRTWSDVSDGEVGLLLANQGLPEVEVLRTETGSEMALTLLRCVGWLSRADLSVRKGHAGPGLPTPGAQCHGTYTFHYALVPHHGGWQQAFTQAYAFSGPFRAVPTPAHDGKMPSTMSFFDVSPETMVISAIKKPEEGDGLIVRMWNADAEDREAVLRPFKNPSRVSLCNLAERDIRELSVGDEGVIRMPVRGREILTLRVEF